MENRIVPGGLFFWVFKRPFSIPKFSYKHIEELNELVV